MRVLAIVLVTVMLVGVTAFGDEEIRTVLVDHFPENVFSPVSFDDNDNAQVVLYGMYPDTCYSYAPVELDINVEKKEFYINDRAYQKVGPVVCADMLVPYTKVIDLGMLPVGEYKMFVKMPEPAMDGATYKLMSTMNIAKATSEKQYNFDYAPVSLVDVEKDKNGKFWMTLKGVLTNTCIRMVKGPDYMVRKNNVVEVLPIMELESNNCKPTAIGFEFRTEIEKMPRGATLFHIRTFGGQSLNKVVDY
jgi:hypothetical protein